MNKLVQSSSLVILYTLLLVPEPKLFAQKPDPIALQRLRMESPWLSGSNAAGMSQDSIPNFHHITLGYENTSGEFKSPLQGRSTDNFTIRAEEYTRLKTFRLWGEFTFRHQRQRDAGYNASIGDPLRGMPFYVIDTHESNWRDQLYDLRFKASHPLGGSQWHIGLSGHYHAGLYAKQRDPRVDTRTYRLGLAPSILFTPSTAHHLGFTLGFTSHKEDSQMSKEESYTDQEYYEVYGLGEALRGLGTGRVTDYKGIKWTPELQYLFRSSAHSLLFTLGSNFGVEDVFISFTTPKKDATLLSKSFHTGLSYRYSGQSLQHLLRIKYGSDQRQGIRYINVRKASEENSGWERVHKDIRSRYDDQSLRCVYTLYSPQGSGYRWLASLGQTFSQNDAEYILPHSQRSYISSLTDIKMEKNFKFGTLSSLLLRGEGSYLKVLKSNYSYGGNRNDYAIVQELEHAKHLYQSSDAWGGGITLGYNSELSFLKNTRTYLRAGYHYLHRLQGESDFRSTWTTSLGFIF